MCKVKTNVTKMHMCICSTNIQKTLPIYILQDTIGELILIHIGYVTVEIQVLYKLST